ncbi:DUF427 domain-containing protein [Rhizobium lusitanum]|uniref:DUF427 domain-containing protein n=1 Tax=Rhizobium lusitanum TaxID=293958 RepID=UPI0015720271|nr:DUF427 domain-containing protein [Rhizobium lusitanum]NTJ11547.1 DUF427 domain-containing protein [Rhizobium lusitanum]
MTGRPILQASPNPPITIEPTGVVTLVGRTIADTSRALRLTEATIPPVPYIPRVDVNIDAQERSEAHSDCLCKGDVVYFSIPAGGALSIDAISTHEAPFRAVAAIKDHLVFYQDRINTIEER